MGIENFCTSLENLGIMKGVTMDYMTPNSVIELIEKMTNNMNNMNNRNTKKDKIECERFYVDFNSLPHQIIESIENDINKMIGYRIAGNIEKVLLICGYYGFDSHIITHICGNIPTNNLSEWTRSLYRMITHKLDDKLIINKTLIYLIHLLNDTINVSTLKYLYIALDGKSAMAKIDEQLKRKMKHNVTNNIKKQLHEYVHDPNITHENEYINKMNIEIDIKKYIDGHRYSIDRSRIGHGSQFMKNITKELESEEYLKSLKKIITSLDKIVASNEKINGEGERKIIIDILENSENESIVIDSNDSDTILLSLISLARKNNNINILKLKSSNQYTLINVNTLYNNLYTDICNRIQTYTNKHDTIIKNICINNIVNDICMLFLMFGNDYIPALFSVTISNDINLLFDIYVQIICEKISNTINENVSDIDSNNDVENCYMVTKAGKTSNIFECNIYVINDDFFNDIIRTIASVEKYLIFDKKIKQSIGKNNYNELMHVLSNKKTIHHKNHNEANDGYDINIVKYKMQHKTTSIFECNILLPKLLLYVDFSNIIFDVKNIISDFTKESYGAYPDAFIDINIDNIMLNISSMIINKHPNYEDIYGLYGSNTMDIMIKHLINKFIKIEKIHVDRHDAMMMSQYKLSSNNFNSNTYVKNNVCHRNNSINQSCINKLMLRSILKCIMNSFSPKLNDILKNAKHDKSIFQTLINNVNNDDKLTILISKKYNDIIKGTSNLFDVTLESNNIAHNKMSYTLKMNDYEEDKYKYYCNKFNIDNDENNLCINDVCEEYLMGVMWTFNYTFNIGNDSIHGNKYISSWSYKYYSSPFVSDIINWIDENNSVKWCDSFLGIARNMNYVDDDNFMNIIEYTMYINETKKMNSKLIGKENHEKLKKNDDDKTTMIQQLTSTIWKNITNNIDNAIFIKNDSYDEWKNKLNKMEIHINDDITVAHKTS
jgi:hypothetical protein